MFDLNFKKSKMKTILLLFAMTIFSANLLAAENNNTQDKKTPEAQEKTKPPRVYNWEVKTLRGKAGGVSSSESEAKEMISLFSKDDFLEYKIITSAPKN
jgi:hypothetical protein